MKMTFKQKERLIRILEVLKSQNCIKSYRIEGDEVGSIAAEWVGLLNYEGSRTKDEL
jgi:hypothetical protein